MSSWAREHCASALLRVPRRPSVMGEQESTPAPASPKPNAPLVLNPVLSLCLQHACRVFSGSVPSPCLPVKKESMGHRASSPQ